MTNSGEEVDTSGDDTNGENRINVFVPDEYLDLFDQMADEYYNGNRSRLIRSAVRTEKEQQENIDIVELQLMRKKIESIEKQLDEISDVIDTSTDQTSALHAGVEQSTSRANAIVSPEKENDDHRVPHDILEILDSHDQPLSMESIMAESGYELPQVLGALEKLVDEGMVDSINQSNDNMLYKLTSPGTSKDD